jgi:hypothetical protein
MRVLLTGSRPQAARPATAALATAGHRVLTCTGPDRPFPCRGVAAGDCPLDEGVAVAVSVPTTIPPEPEAAELGLVCALRRHVPLVVVSPQDDVVGAVELAAGAPSLRHLDAVLAEARRLVRGDVDGVVRRVDGGVQVSLHVPSGTTKAVVDVLAIRAHAAVRRIDPLASSVDVAVGAP